MSIKTTMYVTRESAISRIITVNNLALKKQYRELDSICHEHEELLPAFVDNYVYIDINVLKNWTDTMLGDKLDEPFFRYSMFDNYLIGEDYGY